MRNSSIGSKGNLQIEIDEYGDEYSNETPSMKSPSKPMPIIPVLNLKKGLNIIPEP